MQYDKDTRVSEFFPRYLEHAEKALGHCADTLKNEAAALEQLVKFAEDCALRELTVERVDAWKMHLLDMYASNTARLRFSIGKAALAYAVTLRLVIDNPFDRVELPKMVFSGRLVPDNVLKKFIRLIRHPEVRRIVKLCLYTGMRRAEATLLDAREVHGMRIDLPPERTKNRKGRTVYLNAPARRCLGKVPKEGRVFSVSVSTVNRNVTRAWRELGMGRIRLHDMRHTSATRHYERNKDDKAACAQYGWVDEKSFKPYHHLRDQRVKASMDRVTFRI